MLKNKYLNRSGISEHSLEKLKRPTIVDLDPPSSNYFSYLDQKIFQTFLMANAKNQIEMSEWSLNCNDCRNYWLKRESGFLKQLIKSKCSSGKDLNDTANFINCGTK